LLQKGSAALNRFALMIALACYFCLTAAAEDYLLRLDRVETVEQPKTEQKPADKRLRRIELLARLDAPFLYQIKSETETLRISGALARNEAGSLVIKLRYARSEPAPPLVPPAAIPLTNDEGFFTQAPDDRQSARDLRVAHGIDDATSQRILRKTKSSYCGRAP
jgi:hypothetical protein